jgi:hypothetical protein
MSSVGHSSGMRRTRLKRFLAAITNNEFASWMEIRPSSCIRSAFAAGADVLMAIGFALILVSLLANRDQGAYEASKPRKASSEISVP